MSIFHEMQLDNKNNNGVFTIEGVMTIECQTIKIKRSYPLPWSAGKLEGVHK
jgi:hypothetical protein